MKGIAAACALTVGAAAAAGTMPEAPAVAQGGDILRYAINQPSAGWTPYGPNHAARFVDDAAAQGGTALRIDVRRAGANPWDDGVNARIEKPIRKGDRLVLAFWARAPKAKADAPLAIPFAGITEAQAPYAPVLKGSAAIGPEWKLVEVRGPAESDQAAGRAQAALQLSAQRGTIDLSPVFVLDLGQSRAAAGVR